MCVIMVCDTSRPTEEMVEQAFQTNGHGAGIAWRETDEHGPYLRWFKGIDDVEVIKRLILEAPLPFVAHFRIASIGPHVKALTHPFPVSEDVSLSLQGTTRGSLLFHNGTWSGWKSVLLDCSIRGLWHIPAGIWSDSRAMAKMAHHLGIGYLDFFENEKIIVLDPAESPDGESDGINFLGSQKWVTIEDVCCSNSFFSYRRTGAQGWREVKDSPRDQQPPNESRFDSRAPLQLGPAPLDKAESEEAAGRDRFTAMLGTGGSSTVIPFPQGRHRRKRNRKHRTMDLYRNAVWRKVNSVAEAHRWYAEGILSKNQYKKALQALCPKEKKTWEIERIENAPPPAIVH